VSPFRTPKPASARQRRPRGSLTREIIVKAALVVSERDGYEGLTFQALGAELDAHPTAIYRHFRDKDELMRALIEAIHGETLATLGPTTADWAGDLRALALAVRDSFLRHPAVGQIAAVRTTRGPHEFEVVERIIGCLRRAGFGDREAGRLYRIFADFTLGYAAVDAGLAALQSATREGDLEAWKVQYQALPADRFPNLTAVAAQIPTIDDPANFSTAVDLFIEAFRHRLDAEEAGATKP
jgi:AcrR family transcriptional regulator